MERQFSTGVAYNRNEENITLVNVPDRPGAVSTIFLPLAEANINVDMIIQNIAHDEGSTDVTFTVPQSDLLKSIDVLEKAKTMLGFERFTSDDNVATISVVVVGMRSHEGVASTMFEPLAARARNTLATRPTERVVGKECVGTV